MSLFLTDEKLNDQYLVQWHYARISRRKNKYVHDQNSGKLVADPDPARSPRNASSLTHPAFHHFTRILCEVKPVADGQPKLGLPNKVHEKIRTTRTHGYSQHPRGAETSPTRHRALRSRRALRLCGRGALLPRAMRACFLLHRLHGTRLTACCCSFIISECM